MVDAHDSKSCIARCESSSLSSGTNRELFTYIIIHGIIVFCHVAGKEEFLNA